MKVCSLVFMGHAVYVLLCVVLPWGAIKDLLTIWLFIRIHEYCNSWLAALYNLGRGSWLASTKLLPFVRHVDSLPELTYSKMTRGTARTHLITTELDCQFFRPVVSLITVGLFFNYLVVLCSKQPSVFWPNGDRSNLIRFTLSLEFRFGFPSCLRPNWASLTFCDFSVLWKRSKWLEMTCICKTLPS